ncbi:MAG: NADH-quinone oxidoreductase subunit NuoN [Alphaproteobacteria bacterium]|jgi:NADH-quinone oxidoreductase subunit N|nr:NADH-quinone oxidoreductase subunit NuoN [Alphaproteobacteria bacterium]
MIDLPGLLPALPEIFLACAGMALLMIGVFHRGDATRLVSGLTVASFLVAALILIGVAEERVVSMNGLFIVDGFALFMKLLVLLGSALAVIMSLGFIEREQMARFEYPVLFLFATLGMLMLVSANDLISLYVGLELMSLSLYVVAAFRRDTVRSSEAGMKYFVLGAVSSGMLLYGASLVYGFAGTTNFDQLAAFTLDSTGIPPIGLIIGIVFISAGLAFKVSAVPFHMWTPDVYEGAPTPVTAFFAVAPKIAAMALFVRVLVGPFGDLAAQWQQIIVVTSLLSMILGAFAAINQRNIKRLMAYSSISHVGFALVGLAAGTPEGVRGVLIYMAIYLVMNVGTFACILCMRINGRMVEGIDDLAGLNKTNPLMAFALAVFMFSLAGIPPLAGFFGKLYVFMAAINAELYALAVIGVLSSVVASFYYLLIVKLMYFDEPSEAFDRPIGSGMSTILVGASVFNLFFILAPAPIVDAAGAAAGTLFNPPPAVLEAADAAAAVE